MIAQKLQKDFLFSVFAACGVAMLVVLAPAWENADLVENRDLLRPLVILFGIALIGPVILAAFGKTALRLFPIALLFWFSFKPLSELLLQANLGFYASTAVFILILAGVYLLLRLKKDAALPGVAFFIIGMSAATMTLLWASAAIDWHSFTPSQGPFERAMNEKQASKTAIERDELPDVIYIVPDRYPSAETLRQIFDVDNDRFYAELEKRGFIVQRNALANYPKTFLSLASTLNGRYLEDVAAEYGPNTGDSRPVYKLLENNDTQRVLRTLGYTFQNFGFWWEPTRSNANADENFSSIPSHFFWKTEIEHAIWSRTPLYEYSIQFSGSAVERTCEMIKEKLDRIRQAGNGDRPVFTFAHLEIPHPPFLIDASGNCRKVSYMSQDFTEFGGTYEWPVFREEFIDYLNFLNHRILEIIDYQIARRAPSGRPLLILIQADEGPFPLRFRPNEIVHHFFDYSETELRMKMGIINAVYLNGKSAVRPEELITPINNFRIVFAHLLNADLPPLPHQVKVFRNLDHVYDIRDVTSVFCNRKGKAGDPQISLPCSDMSGN